MHQQWSHCGLARTQRYDLPDVIDILYLDQTWLMILNQLTKLGALGPCIIRILLHHCYMIQRKWCHFSGFQQVIIKWCICLTSLRLAFSFTASNKINPMYIFQILKQLFRSYFTDVLGLHVVSEKERYQRDFPRQIHHRLSVFLLLMHRQIIRLYINSCAPVINQFWWIKEQVNHTGVICLTICEII